MRDEVAIELFAHDGVEAERGIVEDDKLRAVGKRQHQPESHVLALREMLDLSADRQLEFTDVAEREVVVLRHYHELPFPSIAEILGAPVTTVKSRMSRGLSLLRTRLAALET